MAGLLLHLAMGIPERLDPGHPAYSASERRAYALGLLLPDIAKIGSIGSTGDFGRFFEGCSEEDIPTFEEYLRFAGNHHFNPDPRDPAIQDTRNPNLADFFSAGYADLKKPVWKGVFCHLMGDKAFYYKSYCVDDPRAMEDYRREVGEIEVWDSIKWRNSKTGRIYYDDYDILNRRVEDEFGVLERLRRILPGSLVNELLESFAVRFSAAGDGPVYMDLKISEKPSLFPAACAAGWKKEKPKRSYVILTGISRTKSFAASGLTRIDMKGLPRGPRGTPPSFAKRRQALTCRRFAKPIPAPRVPDRKHEGTGAENSPHRERSP